MDANVAIVNVRDLEKLAADHRRVVELVIKGLARSEIARRMQLATQAVCDMIVAAETIMGLRMPRRSPGPHAHGRHYPGCQCSMCGPEVPEPRCMRCGLRGHETRDCDLSIDQYGGARTGMYGQGM